MNYVHRARLLSVSRRNPCLICGYTDWCGFSGDGAIAICMRIADGAVSVAKNGGHVHVLREPEFEQVSAIYCPPEPPPVACIERRHIVYSALLEALPLCGEHADNLAGRGLSDLTVARNGYASLPFQTQKVLDVCESLAIFDDLRLVPGFYTDHKGRWLIIKDNGFLISVRDWEGRIQGCRFDETRTNLAIGGFRHRMLKMVRLVARRFISRASGALRKAALKD